MEKIEKLAEQPGLVEIAAKAEPINKLTVRLVLEHMKKINEVIEQIEEFKAQFLRGNEIEEVIPVDREVVTISAGDNIEPEPKPTAKRKTKKA